MDDVKGILGREGEKRLRYYLAISAMLSQVDRGETGIRCVVDQGYP